LADGVRDVVRHANGLLLSSDETFREATRLIRGAQQHWLFRKHIPDEDGPRLVSPNGWSIEELTRYAELRAPDLQRNRMADYSEGIAAVALDLGLCSLALGDVDAAAGYLAELRAESARTRSNRVRAYILAGELARARGEQDAATKAAAAAADAERKLSDRTLSFLVARLEARLAEDRGDVDGMGRATRRMASLARREERDDLIAEAAATLARGEALRGRHADAAESFEQAATHWQRAGAFYGMALAVGSAARSWWEAGDIARAGDLSYRAARSLWAAGHPGRALQYADYGMIAAKRSEDAQLLALLSGLRDEIRGSRSPEDAPSPPLD
jgi:ATP/maltotriose-dependent transcriptional regulator MalT